MKNITILITQIIAMIFGALTVAGITVDPAVQADIQSQVGSVANAIAGLAIMATALVGSIKSVWDKIRGGE